MAGIQTGIQLQDNFTSVLYGIMDCVNMAVSSMYDMQQAVSADIDTSSLTAAQDMIAQTSAALEGLTDAAQRIPDRVPTPISPAAVSPMSSIAPARPQSVQWQTDSLDVFNSPGAERFQQEIQAVNAMLEQLSGTQDTIARQAFEMDILPPEAFRDMNSLAVRIDNVRERIQQIGSDPVNIGTGQANAEMEQLRGRLSQMIGQQNALNAAVSNMDVEAANNAYLQLSRTVGSTELYIRDNIGAQDQLNQSIRAGTRESSQLMNGIKGAVAAYISFQTVGKVLDISDELTQTQARISLMNDGLQTTDELVNMVFASAQDARGSFTDMAAVVAKFGNNAGDAFGSSEEVVAFANLVQKQMTIAGASTQESSNAMLQLSQALGSGALRGDELNSIFEQAPNLIQGIADYLEVPIGQIREMASEGKLSADIVKASIFAASDEINEKFAAMPMTWGQLWQSFQNEAIKAFQPVLERLNDMANSQQFQMFISNAVSMMAVLADMILNIFDLLGWMGSFVSDNWSIIAPIFWGIAAALAIYYGWQLLSATASGIMTVATTIMTAAQTGLNGALYACPLVWIIILIIALIALFYAAVAAINKFAETSTSATGLICGSFTVAGAFIGNLIFTLINFLIDIFSVLWNFIAAFANFFGNVFNDPVGAIARLFFDLVDVVLSLLQSLASAIDTIFGSNLAGSVQGWRDSLGGWVDSAFGQGKEIMAKMDAETMHLQRFEYSAAWDAGYAFGEGIDDTVSGLFNFGGDDSLSDIDNGLDTANSSLAGISDAAGGIQDSLDIADEDLKYLHDLAEREAVNRFTTAEIKLDMTNHNNISGGMDLDGIISELTEKSIEALQLVQEGV